MAPRKLSDRKHQQIRIRFLSVAVALLVLLLLGKLYYIQIVKHDYYLQKGEDQYVHTVHELYDRGGIYMTTREGDEIAAATTKSGYVLAVDPSRNIDAHSTYQSLKSYLTVEEEVFIHRATLPNRVYVEIEKELPEDVANEIEELDLTGVQLFKQRWRYYPGEELSARTIGFTGYAGVKQGEQSRGLYGLERYYEDVLSRNRERLSVNFFAELFTNLGNLVFDSEEEKKGDVVTTLEPTVSRFLQSELHAVKEKWGSGVTGGIIIDPQTGEIYALDVVPTFDLNNRASTTIDNFRNPLVEDVYEMGSIIKPLTMAAGLDSRAVSPSTTYYDEGSLTLDTWTIHNYDKRGRGMVNMQEVLNQSLNTGVAFVVKTMGKEKFRDYFLSLRLGSETGIDLPGEIPGLIKNLDSPRSIEYATASYGQGIALTPVATVRALAALGNGGELITPHILKRIDYVEGGEKKNLFPEGDRVWSEETSEEISRMLVKVVDEAMNKGEDDLERYSVAAKTGTALLTKPEGGYYEDRYLHSLFGYFPAYEPRFLIFLYTEDPKDATYASQTLKESFMNISKFLINYYNIPPDR